MYIVITDTEVLKAKTLKSINKKLESELNDTDFKLIGNDRINVITEKNLEFVKDIGRISNIPFDKLYKKDTSIKLILYGIGLINLIILFKG